MAAVELKPVYSSYVAAIGYDEDTGELHVVYQAGRHFVYEGVAPAKARDIIAAPSIGTALHNLVRGQHAFRYADG